MHNCAYYRSPDLKSMLGEKVDYVGNFFREVSDANHPSTPVVECIDPAARKSRTLLGVLTAPSSSRTAIPINRTRDHPQVNPALPIPQQFTDVHRLALSRAHLLRDIITIVV